MKNMVNIWDFAYNKPFVRIKKKDGNTIEGKTIAIWEAEEIDTDDDMIAVDLDDGSIENIFQSEIESIERL